MARILCKCGKTMWNGDTPNEVEFWAFSDKRFCSVLENDTISTLHLADLNDYKVWCCPKCKRLYVFEKNVDSSVPKYTYKLEDD